MKTNLLIAATIIVGLTLWMTLGSLWANGKKEQAVGQPEPAEAELPSVRYRLSTATEHIQTISLTGKTIPARSATLRAEISGPIAEVPVPRGAFAREGAPLIKIDPGELPEQLQAAHATAELRLQELQAAASLAERGFQSETRQKEAKSLLRQVEAEIARLERALDDATLKAPFDGVVQERLVEMGEYASPGDPLVQFLELDPLVITAEATENEITKIEVGQHATARIGNEPIDGHIRYVAPNSNPATRTYTVELEATNPGNRLKAGLTAKVLIETTSQPAHYVSPALLYLSADTDGNLGLKLLDDRDRVRFYPTEILAGDDEGVWVAGLPNRTRIITVGQGFVVPGSQVKAVEESEIR